jgi:hypothetical protein
VDSEAFIARESIALHDTRDPSNDRPVITRDVEAAEVEGEGIEREEGEIPPSATTCFLRPLLLLEALSALSSFSNFQI